MINVPFGSANSSLFAPALTARLNWPSKVGPGVTFLLFASMYFLSAERLLRGYMSVKAP